MEIILPKLAVWAKEDLSWCYAEVAQYITESDLKPYFDRIDNATTIAGIYEIVKEANSELYEKLMENAFVGGAYILYQISINQLIFENIRRQKEGISVRTV